MTPNPKEQAPKPEPRDQMSGNLLLPPIGLDTTAKERAHRLGCRPRPFAAALRPPQQTSWGQALPVLPGDFVSSWRHGCMFQRAKRSSPRAWDGPPSNPPTHALYSSLQPCSVPVFYRNGIFPHEDHLQFTIALPMPAQRRLWRETTRPKSLFEVQVHRRNELTQS